MSGLVHDLGQAFRVLVRQRGFSALVIVMLALGIGATIAIYSVAHGLLIEALPYPDPNRIVTLSETWQDGRPMAVAYANFLDWQAAAETLEDMAALKGGTVIFRGNDQALRLFAQFVTPGYVEILGARAHLGRLFVEDDNRVPDGHPVVVISYGLWQSRFGGDPGLVGGKVIVNGAPHTVIGVVAPEFKEPFGAGLDAVPAELWLPAMMAGQNESLGARILLERRLHRFTVLARMAPDAEQAEVVAEMAGIAEALAKEYPSTNGDSGVIVNTLADALTRNLRGYVLVLVAGAGVLLLIACFNVANLILARGTVRHQELAVRRALGARRRDILRLLVIEAFVLALAGGAVGVVGAAWFLPRILGLGFISLPPASKIGVDAPIVFVAFCLSLFAGALCGLWPAFRAGQGDLRTALMGTGYRGLDRGGMAFRRGLVILQVATATVLLAVSAVLVANLRDLRRTDPGFLTEGLLTFQITLALASYPEDGELVRAAEGVRRRVADLPGVEWSEIWGPGRPGQGFQYQSTVPQGAVYADLVSAPSARRHSMSPGTLKRLGIELLRGRDLSATDRDTSPFVAVVSESLAAELWPGEDPIGRRLHPFIPADYDPADLPLWTVIGVARDALHGGRAPVVGFDRTANELYLPLAQKPERNLTVLVRSRAEPDFQAIRDAVRAFDPGIPIFDAATMEQLLWREEGPARFAAFLMGGFALAALLLAALGIYGIMAFDVSRRAHEIGLRIALGADPWRTRQLFLMKGLRLTVIGLTVGSAAAFGLDSVLTTVIVGVAGMELPLLLGAVLLLLVTALAASFVPAWRASRIAPAAALRE